MAAKKSAMTEKAWRNCKRPSRMLDWLTEVPGTIYKGRVQQHPKGRRRLRLFGVAVARRVAHLVSNRHLRALLDAAEAFADGAGTQRQLTRLFRQSGVTEFNFVWDEQRLEDDDYPITQAEQKRFAAQAIAILESRDAVSCTICHANAAFALEGEKLAAESARQCDLLRDIFGNPFRPSAFAKQWRTSTAVGLARTMYESRDFAAMPILADALEEAGCDSPDVLAHCRADTPHVRGCWVVDLVLGKS